MKYTDLICERRIWKEFYDRFVNPFGYLIIDLSINNCQNQKLDKHKNGRYHYTYTIEMECKNRLKLSCICLK